MRFRFVFLNCWVVVEFFCVNWLNICFWVLGVMLMFVFVILNWRKGELFDCCCVIWMLMLLFLVNLIVFLIRFVRICCICVGFLIIVVGKFLLIERDSCKFFFWVLMECRVIMLFVIVERLNWIDLSDVWLVLSFEKLRMLLRIVKRFLVDFLVMRMFFCCVFVNLFLFSSLIMLRILFIGVWILWFMVVRNWFFVIVVVFVCLCCFLSFRLVSFCFVIFCIVLVIWMVFFFFLILCLVIRY